MAKQRRKPLDVALDEHMDYDAPGLTPEAIDRIVAEANTAGRDRAALLERGVDRAGDKEGRECK